MPNDRARVRVAKLIAERGLASRREAESWIQDGRVAVNGKTIDTPAVVVDPDRDKVTVDARPLPPEPDRVYYLMYKPRGCIVTRDDPQGRKTIWDLVDLPGRVESVGRLDFDTEGALVLTNDGALANGLTHPSRHVPKRYSAKVYRTPSEADLKSLREGVYLEDGKTLPAKVRLGETTDQSNAWVEITVTEGRNRLIRRMLAQRGHPVSKLRRESFATISIREMVRGTVRRLTADEVRRLKDLAAGRRPERAGRVRRGKGFAKAKAKPTRHGGKRARSGLKPGTPKTRNR